MVLEQQVAQEGQARAPAWNARLERCLPCVRAMALVLPAILEEKVLDEEEAEEDKSGALGVKKSEYEASVDERLICATVMRAYIGGGSEGTSPTASVPSFCLSRNREGPFLPRAHKCRSEMQPATAVDASI